VLYVLTNSTIRNFFEVFMITAGGMVAYGG